MAGRALKMREAGESVSRETEWGMGKRNAIPIQACIRVGQNYKLALDIAPKEMPKATTLNKN